MVEGERLATTGGGAVEGGEGPAAPARPKPQLERLEIRGVGKWYGSLRVLRDLDLDIAGGEFISLLGPSGCGKTTALNCIAGLLQADSGSITVDGRDVTRLAPERRRFGMVFQNYALFPHLTVTRNVAFGLEMQAVRRREIAERVRESLALVRLEHLGDRYPAQLSGGQQQRVALARTLVTRPRLVLMDEPLSNLDAKLRIEMRMELRRLHLALGLTTIFVTHDQDEALSLSERIVLLRDGEVEQVGTPEEIYSQPRSAYVAGFLGYRNLLPVTVEELNGDQVRVALGDVSRLTGSARGELHSGSLAVAAVRPEDVEVLESGGGIAARIEVTEFAGRHFEIGATAGNGARLVARSTRRWPVGASVSLGIRPERLFVFPGEPA